MKDLRITICGAGTLGSNLAENLARTGTGILTLIDRDSVEARNLANQAYTQAFVGRPKVKALAEILYRAVGARITGTNKRLTPGNAGRLLQGSQVVVDTFDNHESRKSVAEACRRLSIPCLHAGLSADGCGEVIWDERYAVPPDGGGDPCGEPISRSLSMLVMLAATRAIEDFARAGRKRSFTVTIKDLAVMELC